MGEDDEEKGEWDMFFVIPNLLLPQSFEFGDIALVGAGDERIERIVEMNPAASALLSGFDHCLPEGSRPSAAILRKGHGFADAWQAIVDARNMLAVLACSCGKIKSIGCLNRFVYLATEHFDFYPFRPSEDGKYLDCINPETNKRILHLDGFRGAVHPWLFIHPSHQLAIDGSLFKAICAAWERIHLHGGTDYGDRRLMRSLSVAYEAGRTPLHMESLLHDHGKHCSLWVSAFETLAHPGPRNRVSLGKVLDLLGLRKLNGAEWNDREIFALGSGKTKRDFSLSASQQLYRDLHNARNDFLHGNELDLNTFAPLELGEGVRLLDTAPLVFHTALEAHALTGTGQSELIRWNGLEAGLERIYRSERDELRESGEI